MSDVRLTTTGIKEVELLLELLRSRAMDSREWWQWVDEYPVPQGEVEPAAGPRNVRK